LLNLLKFSHEHILHKIQIIRAILRIYARVTPLFRDLEMSTAYSVIKLPG